MREVIHVMELEVRAPDGRLYRPRVLGEETNLGTWEGWIEFLPVTGGDSLSTDRETTQPNRGDLAYWATGLEPIYFEGALERALAQRTTIERLRLSFADSL